MFSAQVWGTVADMIGALSTGGAAISALTYYILDSRKSQSAQARLVRANLEPDEHGIFEVSVTNDSDRPITIELIVYREQDFRRAALNYMPMQTTQDFETYNGWQYHPELMRGDSEGVRFIADRKDQIMGFRHGGGTVYLRAYLGDENCRVLPGQSIKFLVEHLIFRISTDYQLIFFDANGIAWQLDLHRPSTDPVTPKRAHRRGPFKQFGSQSRVRMRPIGYLRVTKRAVRNAIRLRWWLFQHRNEQTTPYPRLTAEIWQELMDARAAEAECEKAPDQDGTS